MAKQIWNQGRVVGYSAYEMYVKNFLEQYPHLPPASERQWTASMLGMGASMLLKISSSDTPAGTYPKVINIKLPENCSLVACNTIVASFFEGDGVYENGSRWAKRVKSYGRLMANEDSQYSPTSGDPKNWPVSKVAGGSNLENNYPKGDENWSRQERRKLRDYLKIIDGVVMQPGEWTATSQGVNGPYKDLTDPSLDQSPVIRLLLTDRIESDVEILLTGFTTMSVVAGCVAMDGSTRESAPIVEGTPRSPDNDSGDFLGPAEFPWSNKIIFTMPTATNNYFMLQKYKRQIGDASEGRKEKTITQVDDIPIIDMRSENFAFYAPKDTRALHKHPALEDIDVEDFSTTGTRNSVITVWSRGNSKYPPVLWGSIVSKVGSTTITSGQMHSLCPLDVAAPGVVKMFPDANRATLADYQKTYPGVFGISKDSDDGTLSVLTGDDDSQGDMVKVAKATLRTLPLEFNVGTEVYNQGTKTDVDLSAYQPKMVEIETGTHKMLALAIGDTDVTNVPGTPEPYTISRDNSYFIEAKDGTSFGIPGYMKSIRPATGDLTWNILLAALVGDMSVDLLGPELKALRTGLRSDPPYIPAGGKRIYLSDKPPVSTQEHPIPEGSIGLGW